jgi:hypothetical protein
VSGIKVWVIPLQQRLPQSNKGRQPSNQQSQRVTASLVERHQKRLVMAKNEPHLTEVTMMTT